MPAPKRGGKRGIKITSFSTAMQPARMPANIKTAAKIGSSVSSVSLQVTLFRQRHAAFVPYDDVIQRSHSDHVQRLL